MNNKNIQATVIIPTFNRASLIDETLNTVLNQTYANWECIIVDDGSTDNTSGIVEQFCETDNRFKFFRRTREPKGAPTCRNIGAEKASGEFLIFLDSDDLLKNDCIEKRVEFAQKDNFNSDFYGFNTYIFESDISRTRPRHNLVDQPALETYLGFKGIWHTSGVLWKKTSFLSIGGFTEGLSSGQDFDLMLRALIQELSFKKDMSIVDSYWRQETNNRISTGSLKNVRNRFRILKNSVELLKSSNKTSSPSVQKAVFSGALQTYWRFEDFKEYSFANEVLQWMKKEHLLSGTKSFFLKSALILNRQLKLRGFKKAILFLFS